MWSPKGEEPPVQSEPDLHEKKILLRCFWDSKGMHFFVVQLQGDGASAQDVGLFAVFDGHGGQEVATYAAYHFPDVWLETGGKPTKDNMIKAFELIDARLTLRFGTMALRFFGGCRRSGQAQAETARIEAVGGCLVPIQGELRVNGVLNISWSLGLMLACDGVSDELSDEQFYEERFCRIHPVEDAPKLSAHLCEKAKEVGSLDNLTCLFVFLRPSKKTRGWRTFLIVPELDRELAVWTDRKKIFDQLITLDNSLAEIYKNLDGTSQHKPHIESVVTAVRALDTALKQLKNSKAVMAFSVDEQTGKVLALAKVDKVLIAKGLTASGWIDQVCTVLGGRGGGKEGQAQAIGENSSRLGEAAELARKFASTTIA